MGILPSFTTLLLAGSAIALPQIGPVPSAVVPGLCVIDTTGTQDGTPTIVQASLTYGSVSPSLLPQGCVTTRTTSIPPTTTILLDAPLTFGSPAPPFGVVCMVTLTQNVGVSTTIVAQTLTYGAQQSIPAYCITELTSTSDPTSTVLPDTLLFESPPAPISTLSSPPSTTSTGAVLVATSTRTVRVTVPAATKIALQRIKVMMMKPCHSTVTGIHKVGCCTKPTPACMLRVPYSWDCLTVPSLLEAKPSSASPSLSLSTATRAKVALSLASYTTGSRPVTGNFQGGSADNLRGANETKSISHPRDISNAPLLSSQTSSTPQATLTSIHPLNSPVSASALKLVPQMELVFALCSALALLIFTS